MYRILIRLILIATLLELGMPAKSSTDCRSGQCIAHLQKTSVRLTKIEWKPISIFKQEGERFKQPTK